MSRPSGARRVSWGRATGIAVARVSHVAGTWLGGGVAAIASAWVTGCVSAGGGSVTVGVDPRTAEEEAVVAVDRTIVPDVGPVRDFDAPTPDEHVLANGLRVWLVPVGRRALGYAELLVRGGASTTAPEEAGLATLVADLLDEGATLDGRDLSALEISVEADRLGARLRTGATYDAVTASVEVVQPRLAEALGLLAAVTVRPTFSAPEVERVRALQVGRLLESRDETRWLAEHTLRAVLYGPDDPYGRPLLGDTTDLSRLDRASVTRYHRRHFTPEGAVLIVVGAADAEDLLAAVERSFGDWTGAGAAPAPAPPAPWARGTEIHVVDKPGAPQSEIRIGAIGVSRATPDYFPLTVLNTLLGGAFTSRLNSVLREEKGLTYGAFSRFHMGVRPGPFVARTAVHTPATAEAVADILREIGRLRDEVVPAAELERAKAYTALELPRRFETAAGRGARMAELAQHGLAPDTYDGYVEGILAVSADDVRRVARRYLEPSELAVVIAGSFETIAPALGTLNLGTVVRRGPP